MASEQDAMKQLREVFDLCDEMKCGYLSIDQLKELGKKYFGGREEEMVQLLECLDPKGQGVITFNDFCRGVATVTQFGGADRSTQDYVLRQNSHIFLEQVFNDNHEMSQDEYKPIALSSLGDCDSAVVTFSDNSQGSPAPEEKAESYSPSTSEGEERYECYGEAEDIEFDENHCNGHISKSHLSSDSFRSTSSAGSTGSRRVRLPHHSHLRRNSWHHSSIHKTNSGKKISANALTSQLFHSGAFNGHTQTSNSRRSSISYDSDDMYTDQLSLEDDVQDLSQKVQFLEQQVTALSHSQTNNEDRYSKVKQENAILTTKIRSLEEQIRELEIRSEERLKEEQKQLKEAMARHEREKSQEVDQYATRLYNLQQDYLQLKEEAKQIKAHAEKLKQEKFYLQEQLTESTTELANLQEEHKKFKELAYREREEHLHEKNTTARLLQELNQEIEELRRYRQEIENSHSPVLLELPSRYYEIERELRRLKEENSALREANEELQAQILSSGIKQGQSLLRQEAATSLAEELENLSKDEVMTALREQQEVNAKLRAYIDGILLNIMENYPQLLEVKHKNNS
ncbi:rab11 family-interacting protein 4A-like isoform X1 [Centruroides sculpturatus]|uniref:rab11 family-interacting protein 4A-like isoform X1 n=2 Tax=Centruroides sculpturatus TaxID=218467 RepID=UPI000C6E4390|nr:rab11 family-interacting protein 4A-like isoform X1 [Centruroides sculpturatus]